MSAAGGIGQLAFTSEQVFAIFPCGVISGAVKALLFVTAAHFLMPNAVRSTPPAVDRTCLQKVRRPKIIKVTQIPLRKSCENLFLNHAYGFKPIKTFSQ